MHTSQSESCLSFYQGFQIQKTSSAGFSVRKSLLIEQHKAGNADNRNKPHMDLLTGSRAGM